MTSFASISKLSYLPQLTARDFFETNPNISYTLTEILTLCQSPVLERMSPEEVETKEVHDNVFVENYSAFHLEIRCGGRQEQERRLAAGEAGVLSGDHDH